MTGIEQQADQILGLVSRVQKVFGGETTPERPPNFAPPVDLEESISRDHF